MATIEIETFTLRDGGEPAEFEVVDERMLEWSYVARPGLLRRTTARDDDRWVVVSWWSSTPSELDAATSRAPAHVAWRAMIDEPSYRRDTYGTVS